MCGLAGFVRFHDGRDGEEGLDRETLGTLGAALAHRGPDGEGCFLSPRRRAGLVHRRLAIIDLTTAADQPMATRDGRFRLIFNGEIFNYRALRTELASCGEHFSTSSDTEVLLALLVRLGPSALSRLRGMFALALWDEADRSLLLARDRFGIKPLYFAASNRRVAFASEIGALRRAGLATGPVSPAGMLAYLNWGSIPAPLTWVEGVESLRPGTWRRWNHIGIDTEGTFADIRTAYCDTDSAPPTAPELRERIGAAVRDSVRAHMVADVPVGIFLSGGIDSSSIVSAARSLTSGEIRTYTIAFPDSAARSEEPFAREVADRFETTHHVLNVGMPALQDDLPRIIRHLDQPTNDAVNSFYVSQAVRSTGLKAVLSGSGADELFGGYPSFRRIPRAWRLRRAFGPLMSATGPIIGARMPRARRAKVHHLVGADSVPELYRALRGYFMPGEQAALLGPALTEPSVWRLASAAVRRTEEQMLGAAGPEDIVASVARMESRQYLTMQLLRDIDAMSMAHALEVRVPFVDHELLSVAWPALSHHHDLMTNKRVLYETLERPIPRACYDRPKQGFTFPFDQWMRGPLGDVIRAGLDEVRDQGWVAWSAPDHIWNEWRAGDSQWARPWALGILGHFLREAASVARDATDVHSGVAAGL